MLKRFAIIFLVLVLGVGVAQETCDSLLQGLRNTLKQTQTLTRKLTMKAGFIEIMSETTLVKKTTKGLEFTILNRTGATPPNGEPVNGPEEQGWLGTIDLNTLSCEDHRLSQDGETYKLELIDNDDESPLQSLKLDIYLREGHYFSENMSAQIKPSGAPFSATALISVTDWQLAR